MNDEKAAVVMVLFVALALTGLVAQCSSYVHVEAMEKLKCSQQEKKIRV